MWNTQLPDKKRRQEKGTFYFSVHATELWVDSFPPLWGKVRMGGIMRGLARQLCRKMTDAERLLYQTIGVRSPIKPFINLTHREIADHLGIHYTTASKAVKRMAPNEK
jgi:hypothetical protein